MVEPEPTAAQLMQTMLQFMKQSKEDQDNREERLKAEKEAEIKRLTKERQEDIDRMLRLRQEDWERNKKIADEENKQRSERDKVKDSQIKTDHAIRALPIISSRELLPTHLENFSDLLHSCGVPEEKRTCRLGEILTGQLSVALQNLKLTADTPFEEVKSQLLRAVGFTQVAAARSYLRPDTDTLKNMGQVDLMNTLESLVTRLLSGANTVDEVHLRLMTANLKNVGNSHCITLLESKTIESRADLRDAVIFCNDNHGSVVMRTTM